MSRLAEIIEKARSFDVEPLTLEQFFKNREAEAVKASARINRQNNLARVSRLLEGANVPEKYANCSFQNYLLCENSPQQVNVRNVCRTYANTFASQLAAGRCMIFTGTTGTGKNHLATAIVNEVLVDGFSALIIKISDLMSKFRATYGNNSGLTEDKLFKQMSSVDLLVLDEIDLSHNSTDERVLLNRLIDSRVLSVKPTIVISNLDKRGLEERLGARIVDRLLENESPMLRFEWPSFRRRKGV